MAQTSPRVFLVDAKALAAQKTKPDAQLLLLAKKEAETALKVPALTVTAKTKMPPSGDKHDYLGMARYFWPNPATPNHLPYIRKDGQTNPEIHEVPDQEDLVKMGSSTRALGLAYYLTGEEKYADHATLLLRTWFLNPATLMNPNMNFAQYIPGVNTGRGAGILDARQLTQAIDAVGMIAGSKSWTPADDAGMKAWFTKYYAWLTTNSEAKKEKAAPNNHGSWFAMQEADVAMYLGKTDDAKKIAEFVHDQRIPSQFDAKGMQKYEMVRTNSFSYSGFNLEALTQLAQIVSSTGVDLYTPVKPGAPSLLTGMEALLPYDAQHPWPHQQIDANKLDALCPALPRFAAHLHDAKYAEAMKRYECKSTATNTLELLAGK